METTTNQTPYLKVSNSHPIKINDTEIELGEPSEDTINNWKRYIEHAFKSDALLRKGNLKVSESACRFDLRINHFHFFGFINTTDQQGKLLVDTIMWDENLSDEENEMIEHSDNAIITYLVDEENIEGIIREKIIPFIVELVSKDN